MYSRIITPFLCTLLAVPNLQANEFYRAAYVFPYAKVYSAAVDKPAYTIVDLGAGYTPVDIADNMTVLMKSASGELVRWTAGRMELLDTGSATSYWAAMNERRSVVWMGNPGNGPELRFWKDGEPGWQSIDWREDLLESVSGAMPYVFNDQNQLALRRNSETVFTGIPPHTIRVETNLLDCGTQGWQTLAAYESTLDEDFILRQGGELLEVTGLNNAGSITGHLYEDEAVSQPFAPELDYAYQKSSYVIDGETVIDFEPLALNDHGTVVGRTAGPLHGLEILDQFGQRALGPALSEAGTRLPRLSSPSDGLEEVVLGEHYFKRMSERDFAGQPTGAPSPDFWQGKLEDLVREPGNWTGLEATCISASGRIAGTGKQWDPVTGTPTEHAFLLLPALLVPDWDRNGSIDGSDRVRCNEDLTWRIWINDDNDSGEVAGSHADDLPASSEPDYLSPGVDGRRDIVDFFPVHLDLQPILRCFDSNKLDKVEVRLSQADAAVNVVYTRLAPSECGRIHREDLPHEFGSAFDKPLENAGTQALGPLPVPLPAEFLQGLRDGNRGVLLLEASAASNAPLVMDFHYGDRKIFTSFLPLSSSPVRDMMRIVNLRNCDPKFSVADPGPWGTATAEPANLPDRHLKAFLYPLRTLVHVHGFNWGGDELPAVHAELFKRLYQTGSHARFVGVSWFGDQGTLDLTGSTFDYNENVINAFITGACLKGALATLSSPFTFLFAHSLGNVVASSAIVDHDLHVDGYFMVNGAVPSEAYMGERTDRRLMVHPDWKDGSSVQPDYGEQLLAANWSRLFPAEDNRSFLSWKDRFASVASGLFCYNFYSSGEEILRKGNGDLPNLFKEIWNRELIWTYNEMVKGTATFASTLTADVHGGWGFNRHYMNWYDPGGAAHPPPGSWVPMSTLNAEKLTTAELALHPFFKPFSTGDADFPAWGDGNWLYADTATANGRLPHLPLSGSGIDLVKNHAKILAEAIPGHSAPAGVEPVASLALLKNFNMDVLFRSDTFWPARGEQEKEDRWLHSDYLNPALVYVSGFFTTCNEYINNKR